MHEYSITSAYKTMVSEILRQKLVSAFIDNALIDRDFILSTRMHFVVENSIVSSLHTMILNEVTREV